MYLEIFSIHSILTYTRPGNNTNQITMFARLPRTIAAIIAPHCNPTDNELYEINKYLRLEKDIQF